MRKAIMALAVLAMMATPALGGIGDWWVLPIDRLDGNFTVYPGCGYDCGNGPTDCYEGSGQDGIRRVWWNTDNACESSGAAMPATLEEFTIEAFGCTCPDCGTDWQPIQVQINGYHGPLNWPIDPEIPWAGQFGTNHEWIGSNGSHSGQFDPTGPGPQVHGDGTAPYIKAGSVLYAKWDFGWPITRCWDSIRITQITPEPASALLLLLGAPVLLRRKRR